MNQLAVLVGTAVDETKGGKLQVSGQFAVPQELGQRQGAGKEGRGYYVETAVGKDVYDAFQNLQEMLPRKIHIGHRRGIFIGESLARSGISNFLDEYVRNPDARLRSDMFVVEGRDASDFLQAEYPFEHFSAIAAAEQDRFCRTGDTNLRNFLIDAASESRCPTLSTIEMIPKLDGESKSQYVFLMNGTAVFDKALKLVGILKAEESLDAVWIMGRLGHQVVTEVMPEKRGYISVGLTHLRSNVTPAFQSGRPSLHLELRAVGLIRENNTTIDVSKKENLAFIQKQLNKKIASNVQETLAKVQKQYQADIFGFGEAIRRTSPLRWRHLEPVWGKVFAETPCNVTVHVTIERVGSTGLPLHLANRPQNTPFIP